MNFWGLIGCQKCPCFLSCNWLIWRLFHRALNLILEPRFIPCGILSNFESDLYFGIYFHISLKSLGFLDLKAIECPKLIKEQIRTAALAPIPAS